MTGATRPRPSAPLITAPCHSHVPKRKTIGSDRVTEDFSREGDKKRRRETREGFLEKKDIVFRGDSAPGMTVKGLNNKRKKNQ
jgi:hypothetical protein